MPGRGANLGAREIGTLGPKVASSHWRRRAMATRRHARASKSWITTPSHSNAAAASPSATTTTTATRQVRTRTPRHPLGDCRRGACDCSLFQLGVQREKARHPWQRKEEVCSSLCCAVFCSSAVVYRAGAARSKHYLLSLHKCVALPPLTYILSFAHPTPNGNCSTTHGDLD